MQEQQQNSDNMIANSISINNLKENFQPLENSTIVEKKSSSPMSGICYIKNFTDINKTSPLSMPSGIIIMQPNQQNNLKFYTETTNDNEQYNNTSENTKDLLLTTTNYSQQTTIINNINNNLNSHYINNSNLIKLNSTKTTENDDNDKTSAFNCKTNSDNNLLLLNNNNVNNYNLSNGYNTTELKIINSIEKIQQSPIASPIVVLSSQSTVNKNLDLSSSLSVDHENAYNQRSYVEDVHNYSKKSNGYELSSSGSNNTSSGTDEYDSDDNYNDDDGDLIRMNKIKRNYNKKLNIDNETDNNNKWLKVVKNHNQNKLLKRKLINNNHNNNDYDNNVKDKLLINMNSKTPDSGVPPDDDEKLTPDHHARRPMNAFLIFCKRHRAIVRDKYKNVENRQITKILGEWWANMTEDEKRCYANLAKENKDQFLSANPNFKWYKLPAPPLRTLTTRPLNNNTSESLLLKKDEDKNQLSQLDFNEHITLKNHTHHNTSINQQHQKKLSSPAPLSTKSQASNVGVFKFADETQMGSLNNLICGGDGTTDNNSPTHSMKSSSLSPNNDEHHQSDELQNALGETSDFLCNTITKINFPTTLHEPFENMRDHAKKMKNSKLNNGIKRKLPATIINNYGKKILRDNSFSSSEDDGNITNRKLSRTCKGKKYQELINSGQISILSKKPKKLQDFLHNVDHSYSNGNPNNNYSKDSSSDSDFYNNISPQSQNEFGNNSTGTNNTEDNGKMYTLHSDKFQSIDNTVAKKQCDMSDFDLDSKIMALPAQCLEQYLLKKQESKSKKKINSKRRKTSTSGNKKQINNNITNGNSVGGGLKEQPAAAKTIQEIKEQIVGSQKRKARKESITRRDVSAIQNEAKLVNYVEFGNGGNGDAGAGIEIKEELTDSLEIEIADELKAEQNFRATDLLILAEVASNVDD